MIPKFDPKTEKLVQTPEGLRIYGEETISFGTGRNKIDHTYRWRRDAFGQGQSKQEAKANEE